MSYYVDWEAFDLYVIYFHAHLTIELSNYLRMAAMRLGDVEPLDTSRSSPLTSSSSLNGGAAEEWAFGPRWFVLTTLVQHRLTLRWSGVERHSLQTAGTYLILLSIIAVSEVLPTLPQSHRIPRPAHFECTRFQSLACSSPVFFAR
jgi:hypothetical protein